MIRKNKTALMKAADLLARQEYSENLLRKKLTAKKYEPAEIDAAINKLKKFKYLNDDETCARFFENMYAEEKLSVKQICVKLIQRGYDSNFVESLVPAETFEREFNSAFKIIVKKFAGKNFSADDMKIKNRIYQHLAAKGFSGEIISAVIEKFLNGDGN